MGDWFHKFSTAVADRMGSPVAFLIALVVIATWAVSGPIFHFSDTWQLVINTGTTIVTFLMVFLIQNTQNRDAKAIHLKLDELLRGVEGARTDLVDLEDLPDADLKALAAEFKQLSGRQARLESEHQAAHRVLKKAHPELEDALHGEPPERDEPND
jgi:low affinity Fe/Cu permease